MHSQTGSVSWDRSFVPEKLSQVFHMFRRYWQVRVTPFGMTVPQFNVLSKLDQYGEMNPSQLAQLLFSDRPTITVILRNLVKHGWVKKARDESNRKFVKVRITNEGDKKLAKLKASVSYSSIGFDPLACFAEDELNDFERHLDKLIRHLQALPMTSDAGNKSGSLKHSS